MKEKIYTQQEIMETLIPVLKSEGLLYKKSKAVFARKAKPGERINSITSDGFETTNTAKEGGFVVKNQTTAQELYIVGGDKFKERYEFLEETEDGFAIYKAKGKVIAIQITKNFLKEMKFEKKFLFIAPWDEEVVVKKDDFLVCPPDYSEIYRIARKEFFETYCLDE
ncbi:MAG: hypothetical protein ACI8VT_000961 [Saprospiraceae bacterium]|jgi:hypothetical protein